MRNQEDEKSEFTAIRIAQAQKEHEAGKNIDDICLQPKINRNTLYNPKKKYSGMDSELLRKYKELVRENSQLKRMNDDLSLDHTMLKEVIEKKL